MLWEGLDHPDLLQNGLAIARAIHDRYNAALRNPYNEIEYGNHYTRAMSGYAPFVAAGGFIYNGPAGRIGFNPKINPEHFSAAFITAEGWGNYSQKVRGSDCEATLKLEYGKLAVNELNLSQQLYKENLKLYLNERELKVKVKVTENKMSVTFDRLEMKAGDTFKLK